MYDEEQLSIFDTAANTNRLSKWRAWG